MENFVVGLCMFGLVTCILYWERRADKRWAERFDIRLPMRHEYSQHRKH
jgi:hypothetical protein